MALEQGKYTAAAHIARNFGKRFLTVHNNDDGKIASDTTHI